MARSFSRSPAGGSSPEGPPVEELTLAIEPVPSSPEGDARLQVRRLQVRLLQASGARPEPFEPPFGLGELEELERSLVSARHLRPDTGDGDCGDGPRAASGDPTPQLREIGGRLFESLARGSVGRELQRWVDRTAGGRGRLRLQLDPDHPRVRPLLDLPWELLHDPHSRRFLARDARCSVVRSLPVDNAPPAPPARLPLRVLVAHAAPADLPALDGAGEVESLRRAARRHAARFQVETFEASSAVELRRKLEEGSFDVLHFIGHGDFETGQGESGRGRVLFGQPGGPADPVTGRTLAQLLQGLPHLRLVVLNACETARDTAGGAGPAEGDDASPPRALDPWSGVASALVREGLPAVVAMGRPISDAAARAFAESFYLALARGRPVDAAVVAGRKAVRATSGCAAEWATPALYLQAGGGDLFDLRPAPLWPLGPRHRRPLGLATLGVLLVALVFAFDPGPPYRAWMNPPQCPTVPEVALRFEKIPAGAFLMGSEEGEANEKPVHERSIEEPFCMGKYEVTRRQWLEVMGSLPGADGADLEQLRENLELPVGRVTYELAGEFLAELNRRAGALEDPVYRLPTEAEWEHAARAGTRTAYSFGDDPAQLHRHGNCLPLEGAPQDRFEKAAPVGSFEPNPWGLHDVHGNVWEWVSTPYGPYSADQPLELEAPKRLGERLRRGGSYQNRAYLCRSATRDPHNPTFGEQVNGLRVVREVAGD